MNLIDCRKQLDRIDKELLELFSQRMQVVDEVAAYKKEKGMPILDEAREQEKINTLVSFQPKDMTPEEIQRVFEVILEVSRKRQEKLLGE